VDGAGFAFGKGGGVAGEEILAEGLGCGGGEFEGVGGEVETGEAAGEIPTGRREEAFVEVVDVKIDQAILALVATKVLQMQIATTPDEGRGGEQTVIPGEVFVEQVAGAAQKTERIDGHLVILTFDALRETIAIEFNYPIDDVTRYHIWFEVKEQTPPVYAQIS
jgi:hypothetical protein